MDDPSLPLHLEATRRPRLPIPPPPPREDALWIAVRAAAAKPGPIEGIEEAEEHNRLLLATLTVAHVGDTKLIESGPFSGWRVLATVERLTCPSPDHSKKIDHTAKRYRAVEVRRLGDRQALAIPPIAIGDLRTWLQALPSGQIYRNIGESQPIIGADMEVLGAGDGRQGLGVPEPLLAPTPTLVASLRLRPGNMPFVLYDHNGPALALATWRTQYETSDYHLAWPRLRGSAILIRPEVLNGLNESTDGNLVLRDFIVGSVGLLACDAPAMTGRIDKSA